MNVTTATDYNVRVGRRGLRCVVTLNGDVVAVSWTRKGAARQADDVVSVLERLFHIRVLARQYDDLGPA